jgi:Zn-dependent peptidase ImmA (M78 family)
MSQPAPLRARYSKIDQLVDRLLAQHHVSTPVVHVEKMVKAAGVLLKRGDLGDVSGLMVRRGGELVIGVNNTQSLARQRFTIAHEFGHYLLHEGISTHFDRDFKVNFRSTESSQATNVEEIEANFFAASILMPKAFLDHDHAVEQLDSDSGVKELARRYGVSQHAMSLRLANLYGRHRPY